MDVTTDGLNKVAVCITLLAVGVGTDTGTGPNDDSLRMISTNSMLTGNSINRHAKIINARVDSAIVPTKPTLNMATIITQS